MPYSRQNPSPRYRYLNEQYRSLHAKGDAGLGIPAKAMFDGRSLFAQAARIKRLVEATGARTILDYGCGKATQYDPEKARAHAALLEGAETVMDYWDVDSVHCYDPAYEPLSKLPEGRFDGVICTDVLEHCPEEDVPWIIDELFGYASRFVFANVACYPARKRLPDGSNAHCTIQPPPWWERIVREASNRHPEPRWEIWVQYVVEDNGRQRLEERRIAGEDRT